MRFLENIRIVDKQTFTRKEVDRLLEIVDELRASSYSPPFDPSNHHNALACPYCNPDNLSLSKQPPKDSIDAINDHRAASSCSRETDTQEELRMGHVRLDECSDGKETRGLKLYDRISQKIQQLSEAKSEVEHMLKASGAEMDILRARAEAAEHRRAAAEYRAQRIVLDKELLARAEKAEALLASRASAPTEEQPLIKAVKVAIERYRVPADSSNNRLKALIIALETALSSPSPAPTKEK